MDKTGMKLLGGIVLLMALWMACFSSLFKEVGKDWEKAKLNVGKRIILEKDTLLIVDYSNVKQTYKLSNGAEIAFELLPSLKEAK